jgi:hypothetical protein
MIPLRQLRACRLGKRPPDDNWINNSWPGILRRSVGSGLFFVVFEVVFCLLTKGSWRAHNVRVYIIFWMQDYASKNTSFIGI